MNRNARTAFTTLTRISAPVRESSGEWGEQFIISGEDNYPETWADFYDGRLLEQVDPATGEIIWQCGVNPKITRILKKHNLMCEWINAGMLGVYNA